MIFSNETIAQKQFSLLQKSSFFVLLMILLTPIRIYLPWTPVPITLQTLTVLLAGVYLGPLSGTLSILSYLLLKPMIFSGHPSLFISLLGPVGGYLVSFLLIPIIVGSLLEKFSSMKRFVPLFILFLISSFIILSLGTLHLWFWQPKLSFYQVFLQGFFPFILGDCVKCFIAASIGSKMHKVSL